MYLVHQILKFSRKQVALLPIVLTTLKRSASELTVANCLLPIVNGLSVILAPQ
jgi:hypothetical protein